MPIKKLFHKTLVISTLLFAITSNTALTYTSARVNGTSMQPTLYDDDLLFYSPFIKSLFGIHRNDIILAHVELFGKEMNIVKRVIGLPGENIQLIDGYVYIDGICIDEPYLLSNTPTNGTINLTLSEDEYFVMGDNRKDSTDSRHSVLGTITAEQIYGVVIKR